MKYVKTKGKVRTSNHSYDLKEVTKNKSFGILIQNSGLEVIDVDDMVQAECLFNYLTAHKYNFILQKTTKGLHFIFRSNPEYKMKNNTNAYNALGLTFDVRSTSQNGYIIHKYEGEYRRLTHNYEGKFSDIKIEHFESVARCIDIIPKILIPIKTKEKVIFANLSDGDGRNGLLYSHIGKLKFNNFDDNEIEKTINDINYFIFKEPIEAEVESLFKNYENQKLKPQSTVKEIEEKKTRPLKLNLDEMYNHLISECITKTVGNDLYWYTGNMWTYDMDEIKRYIGALVHPHEPRITSRDIAELYNQLLFLSEQIELHQNAVTFTNCTIDFNKMKKVDTKDVITKYYIDIEFNEEIDSEYELILKMFLHDLMRGDADYIKLILQIFGDILEPRRTNQKLIFFTGESGANGKSTLTNLIGYVYGSANYSARSIKDYANTDMRFARFAMVDKLFNIDDDTTSKFINPELPKSISGDGTITVEEKNVRARDTKIEATLLHNSNKIPNLGGEGGIKRRVLIVPFEREFTEEEQIKFDETKKQDLFCEKMRQTIIAIAFAELKKGKSFIVPEKSKNMFLDYEEENKHEVPFLRELHENWDIYDDYEWTNRFGSEPIRCTDYLWGMNAMYASFKVWCNANGIRFMPTQREFKNAILKTGMVEVDVITNDLNIMLKKKNSYYKWTNAFTKKML